MQARDEVRFGLSRYIDYIRQLLPLNVPVDSDLGNLIDTLQLAGHGVVGTPEMAVRHIGRVQELSGGVGTFLIEHADWADFAHTKAHMELFAREVAPHFTGRAQARLAAYARELEHDPLTRRTVAEARAAADVQHAAEVRERRQKVQLAAAAGRVLDDVLDEAARAARVRTETSPAEPSGAAIPDTVPPDTEPFRPPLN